MSVYKINAKVANNGVKALKSRRTCWNCLNGNPRLPEYTVITHGCSDLTQKPRRSHQSGNINCPQDPIKKKARQVHRNTPTSHPTLSHTHTHMDGPAPVPGPGLIKPCALLALYVVNMTSLNSRTFPGIYFVRSRWKPR